MTGTGRMFFIGMLVCLLGACASPKDVVYLQDVKINSRVKAALQYRTVIHVDDLLSIVVSCDDIETALPFNTPMIGLGQNTTRTGNDQLYGYLVDTDGTIDFPVLGKIKVEGLCEIGLFILLFRDIIDNPTTHFFRSIFRSTFHLDFRCTDIRIKGSVYGLTDQGALFFEVEILE